MTFAGYMAWLANRRTTQAKADEVRRTEQLAIEAARLAASESVLAQLRQLTADLAILQVKVQPFWAAAQTEVAKNLTHPSAQFAEMDGLLRSLEALTITDAERDRLHDLLWERTVSVDAEVSDIERKKARVMIELMEIVVHERLTPQGSPQTLSMVIPQPEPAESPGKQKDDAKLDDAKP